MLIAMVGARFSGLDGVSLESAKVAEVLEASGHSVAWFGGEIGPGFEPATVERCAGFDTADNEVLERLAFDSGNPQVVSEMISDTADTIQMSLSAFLADVGADAMMVQNAWAIPMQLPLAVAAARVADEVGLPTVGHHHDFAWERPRFARCVVPDVLTRFFPPHGDHIAHVVINSIAQADLECRRGLSSTVLPNVMDFASGDRNDDGGESFRQLAGLDEGDVVLLQPTRIIERKGIEHTIELASKLDNDPKVVVTHPDDRDSHYWGRLEELAVGLGVDLRLVDAGRDRHGLSSAYAAADLVCFPSLYEGYGNALVEAVFFEKPVFVNRYPVFAADIAPLGFEFIEIDGVVDDRCVARASDVINNRSEAREIVRRNFEIGRRLLSYETAAGILDSAFSSVS